MAHSYVDFRENSVHMHDAEILASAFYVLRFAQEHPQEFPEEDFPILSAWQESFDAYVSGCIDLELDETLTSPDDVDSLRNLVAAARQSLLAEPDPVSGARLNAMIGADNIFSFGDRDRKKMIEDFDRLFSVLDPGQ